MKLKTGSFSKPPKKIPLEKSKILYKNSQNWPWHEGLKTNLLPEGLIPTNVIRLFGRRYFRTAFWSSDSGDVVKVVLGVRNSRDESERGDSLSLGNTDGLGEGLGILDGLGLSLMLSMVLLAVTNGVLVDPRERKLSTNSSSDSKGLGVLVDPTTDSKLPRNRLSSTDTLTVPPPAPLVVELTRLSSV